MDKIDHLMAEKNKNNKDSQKGQVIPKKIFKKELLQLETVSTKCVITNFLLNYL